MRSITSPAAMSRFSSVHQPAAVLLPVLLLQLTGFIASTTSSSSQRIAEGESTTLGEYPYVLSLGLTSWANVYHLHYCAGSIITETWVITSARCVEDAAEDVSRYYWLAGTNNLRQGGVQYPISQIVIHPGYNPNDSFIHDLALVQVRHPFEFSAAIQPIELSTAIPDHSSTGTSGVVVGWGEVSQTVIQPDVLRSVNVTVLDIDLCRQVYAPWDLNIDGEYQFCALTAVEEAAKADLAEIEGIFDDPFQERSACRGDEGGPFVPRVGNFPFVASGLVSWTYGCTPFGYPAVYTKVSSYLQWISQITGYWI